MMTKLKTIMVMNGARGLLYDLLSSHQFSDDDEGRILRCAADLSDCVKKSDENVVQTDLRNIEDIQYPSRHDKTAYELKIENNKLQAEINRLREEKSEIEIELKNTEQTCYSWQRLVESLEEQNNQLKAENDKLREAIRLARDTAYQETQDCPRCGFIDDLLTKALNGESEVKC